MIEIVEVAYRETILVESPPAIEIIETAEQGMPGPPGPAAPAGGISEDPGNNLATGNDGGLFVPDCDIAADPLAYYILARS